MSRQPAVAGQFYDGTREGLKKEIERCFLGRLGPGKLPVHPKPVEGSGRILGLVCPHAGYYYSGSAAAHSYAALAADGVPEIAVYLGPNHYGLGPVVSVSSDDSWETPLGTLHVDADTTRTIVCASEYAESDRQAHAREHSIEVQLPFLQYIGGAGARIAAISIAHLSRADALALAPDLGSAIASAVKGMKAVVIASTDFSHYEPQAAARARDALAIEQIVKLDSAGLIDVVYSRDITMCGVIGVAVMIEACKRLGATSARKLTYYTSGDVSGDTSQVVGYGALAIERDNATTS